MKRQTSSIGPQGSFALPGRIYTRVGSPGSIRFSNIAFNPIKNALLYDVIDGPGAQNNEGIVWKNDAEETNPQNLRIALYSGSNFRKLGEQTSEIYSTNCAAHRGKKGKIRWLAIGDSLTVDGGYISQTIEICSELLPKLEVMPVGTQPSTGVAMPLLHEGRGGWTWGEYLTSFSPDRKSPFVFAGGDFNSARYIKASHKGKAPQIITVLLGVNDVFAVSGSYSERKIKKIVKAAESLIAALREGSPDSILGIVVPPPCSDQDAFGSCYRNGVTEWQYRRTLQDYVSGLLTAFDGRWNEGIYIIPAHLDFDPSRGYPKDQSGRFQDALHPNAEGYRMIGNTIGNWIMHLFSTDKLRA